VSTLEKTWYDKSLTPPLWARALEPVFRGLSRLRQRGYQCDILSAYRPPVPVIIVGNITVGGSGKTPMVIYLVEMLRQAGLKPGVISRGYGGKSEHYPLAVTAESQAVECGDEPLLIARRTKVPLVVDPKRGRAAQHLLAEHDVDVIISDDGLQHYALSRDVELVVVDGERRYGNQRCLPAGPLREPLSRLSSVDFVINNGGEGDGEHTMRLQMSTAWNLAEPERRRTLNEFDGKVAAMAGIGNPERFFSQLESQGLDITRHPFADHHAFEARDLPQAKTLLMTEKDAVKCFHIAQKNAWAVSVEAVLPDEFRESLLAVLRTKMK
jgi:tetraacyldisaccharide 4'-kinase